MKDGKTAGVGTTGRGPVVIDAKKVNAAYETVRELQTSYRASLRRPGVNKEQLKLDFMQSLNPAILKHGLNKAEIAELKSRLFPK